MEILTLMVRPFFRLNDPNSFAWYSSLLQFYYCVTVFTAAAALQSDTVVCHGPTLGSPFIARVAIGNKGIHFQRSVTSSKRLYRENVSSRDCLALLLQQQRRRRTPAVITYIAFPSFD